MIGMTRKHEQVIESRQWLPAISAGLMLARTLRCGGRAQQRQSFFAALPFLALTLALTQTRSSAVVRARVHDDRFPNLPWGMPSGNTFMTAPSEVKASAGHNVTSLHDQTLDAVRTELDSEKRQAESLWMMLPVFNRASAFTPALGPNWKQAAATISPRQHSQVRRDITGKWTTTSKAREQAQKQEAQKQDIQKQNPEQDSHVQATNPVVPENVLEKFPDAQPSSATAAQAISTSNLTARLLTALPKRHGVSSNREEQTLVHQTMPLNEGSLERGVFKKLPASRALPQAPQTALASSAKLVTRLATTLSKRNEAEPKPATGKQNAYQSDEFSIPLTRSHLLTAFPGLAIRKAADRTTGVASDSVYTESDEATPLPQRQANRSGLGMPSITSPFEGLSSVAGSIESLVRRKVKSAMAEEREMRDTAEPAQANPKPIIAPQEMVTEEIADLLLRKMQDLIQQERFRMGLLS